MTQQVPPQRHRHKIAGLWPHAEWELASDRRITRRQQGVVVVVVTPRGGLLQSLRSPPRLPQRAPPCAGPRLPPRPAPLLQWPP